MWCSSVCPSNLVGHIKPHLTCELSVASVLIPQQSWAETSWTVADLLKKRANEMVKEKNIKMQKRINRKFFSF